jgi:hypothetical protein
VSYVDDAGLDRGAEVLRHDMARLAECVRTNHWPCYSDDLVPVSLPAWAFYDN